MIESIEMEDFCCFDSVKVPLAKQGLVWIGGKNADTESASSNGSGKSTIFKALTWGLYGKTIDGEDGDKVIRHGTKQATVWVRFKDGTTVVRTRRKSQPRIRILEPSGEVRSGSKAALQGQIVDILGLDFEAFRNTVLYAQNDAGRFTNPSTKDRDRKEMLHRILRTDVLQRCQEVVKARSIELGRSISEAENSIDRNSARKGEYDLSVLARRSKQFEKEALEESKQLRDNAAAAVRKAKLNLTMAKLPPEVSRRLATYEEPDFSVLNAEAECAAEDFTIANEELSKALLAAAKADARAKALLDSIKDLDGDQCPLCRGDLTDGAAAAHIEGVKSEAASMTEEAKAAKDWATCAKDSVKSASARASRALAERKKLDALAEDHEKDLELLRKAREARRRCRELKEKAANLMVAANAAKRRENPHRTMLEEARKKVADLEASIAKSRVELETLSAERAHYEFWSRGFGPSGLPSYVLDSTMPFLTERTNRYLETLSDGDITMAFSTQKELKSSKGEMRDKIDISWVIEGVPGYPPSGGQLKKMELATDLALMDLVSSKEAGKVDLLCLDEVLDGLDAEGRSRVLSLLQELRGERGTILVVSHEGDLSEVFEKSITVTKGDGKSVVEMDYL